MPQTENRARLHQQVSRTGGLITHQRIARGQLREHGKIAVGGPQFAHAMVHAQRGDAGVMDPRPGQAGSRSDLTQLWKVTLSLSDELKIAAGQPGIDTGQARLEWCGRFKHLWMGDNSYEFMHTRP